jgi:hypothetical protein
VKISTISATGEASMFDQYVKVTFPTDRFVRVDGTPAGFTNKEFQVESGEHRFDLGEPKDYKPDERVVTVNNTLPGHPEVIRFQPK